MDLHMYSAYWCSNLKLLVLGMTARFPLFNLALFLVMLVSKMIINDTVLKPQVIWLEIYIEWTLAIDDVNSDHRIFSIF